MIINHNMNAMNAHRNMMGNVSKAGKSMEKLSSGLRINRAGDDAAGLAISEKMRAQVRGLDMASKNAQDGISLIQTAEGALNETHSILQRMRELAVQAGNDTNTDKDREQIQKEINQLTSEVNRIGNTTEFNTQKLLTSGVSKEAKDNILKGLKTGWLEKPLDLIKNAYGIEPTGSKELKVVIEQGAKNDTLASVGGVGNTLTLKIEAADFEKGDGESGNNIHGDLYNDRIIAHEMTHAVMNDALGYDKMNELHDKNKVWFIEGTAEGIAGADERLKGVIINDAKDGLDTDNLDKLVSRAEDLLNGAKWNGDNLDYAAGYAIVKYMEKEAGVDFSALMSNIKTSGDSALQTEINKFKTGFSTNLKSYLSDASKVHLDWSSDHETDVGSLLGSDHGGSATKAEDVVKGTTAEKDQPLAGKLNIIWPEEGEGASEINLQIGANKGQAITVKLEDMRASALGITTSGTDEKLGVTNGTSSDISEQALNVLSHDDADAAIEKFGDAIEKVSTFRAKLGAYQNRLEHTINNLGTASENLQAAESRIRDVDMASEMMNFSKNNILQQAAQAMLAQANQQPQGVLQLLR